MMKTIRIIVCATWAACCFVVILPRIVEKAYTIRLHAVNEYGPIIHEFDPYFNFRATEYLYYNGWQRFATWFDYNSWYPLGRPVGTTIYPGMQVTAVFIKNHVMKHMSLNDVCVYIPAWFGSIASIMTGMIAYECSLPALSDTNPGEKTVMKPFGSIFESIPIISLVYSMVVMPILSFVLNSITLVFGSDLGLSSLTILPTSYKLHNMVDLSSPAVECGLIAASIMSIVPAHMMRSIGGGYDNESVANTAMTMTFFLWCRTLRGGVNYKSAWTLFWGALTAVSYFYMVAVWGGYVFVINLIGVHAGVLVLLGRFGPKLHRAYSVFYFLGTALACQVPVVGWTPLKSLEQLGPMGVFVGFQLLAFCDYYKVKKKLNKVDTWKLRVIVFLAAGLVAAVFAYVLDHYFGYFGPISARVRGLFVKHTKTGNPLVDSVAEHQPASSEAYKQYLGESLVKISPFGMVLIALRYFHDSSSFLLVYGLTTYFFSHKMVRLILLTAPIASILAGIVLGRLFSFFAYNIIGVTPSFFDIFTLDEVKEDFSGDNNKKVKKESKKKSNGKKTDQTSSPPPATNEHFTIFRSILCKLVFVAIAYFTYTEHVMKPTKDFISTSEAISKQMSHPTIVMKAKLRSGEEVKVDDYRECYWWIRDNTPKDARIMAWWDYGYQITAIANRTTIADGNTWNHEHIALLGRALTSSEKEGHRIARHMADYVLVWAGGGGDDLAKSPHLARIANSVYRSMCPNDPTCSQFGATKQHGPSKMMRESLLYKLVSHGKQNEMADPNRFKHRFTSKYGKCRVFKVLSISKESKEWVADPKNRDCDAPGSWFCRGQYPPGMKKILSEKRDFSQLEDFNKDEDDSEYQKKYFENLNKKKTSVDTKNSPTTGPRKQPWKPSRKVSKTLIAKLNSEWKDTEQTSSMWNLINQNKLMEFMDAVAEVPELAHMRSADGRGPMWWAMETGNVKIVRVLQKVGVSESYTDANGLTPRDLLKKNVEL